MTIWKGKGNDQLYGSLGKDDLFWGEGADTFHFQSALLNVSTIKDASAEDRLTLDNFALDAVDFIAENETRWQSADGRFVLTQAEGALTIQTLDWAGKA
jgi:Ca2+-binding RTX toxin-like protein